MSDHGLFDAAAGSPLASGANDEIETVVGLGVPFWGTERSRELIAAQAEAEEAKAERCKAALATLERQDRDSHALAIRLSFSVRTDDGQLIFTCDEHEDDWEIPEGADLTAVVAEIRAKLAPWVDHFRTIGFPAPYDLAGGLMGGLSATSPAVTFYLVYASEDEGLRPARLAVVPEGIRWPLESAPGAILGLSADAQPVNSTLLYDAASRSHGTCDHWAGDAVPGALPHAGESRDGWLGRVATPTDALARIVERWARSGGHLDLYAHCGSKNERSGGNKRIEFIIPGLIPRGYVSLLVGTQQAGKSTLLGEMAAVIDSECETTRTLLGAEVTERGVSVIVSGEEGPEFSNEREEYYEPIHGEAKGFVFAKQGKSWAETLEMLYRVPVIDFLALDTFRSMLDGNEDSSDVITHAFNDLDELAQAKNCAILASHHLSKNAPNVLSRMLGSVRGSGVFIQRPRVVMGMAARGAFAVEIGIIKRNIPPGHQMWGALNEGKLFQKDADTLTLVPFGQASRSVAPSANSTSHADLIWEAIGEHNRLGIVLRRTGKSELYELRLPALVGLSRSGIRDGVAALLAAGRVIDGPDGLHAIVTEAASVAHARSV